MIKTFLAVAATAMLLAQAATAQTQIDVRKQIRVADFSAVGPTKPFETGSVLPATCTSGQMFFLTTALPGNNIYGCSTQEVWLVMGGMGLVILDVDGTLIGNQGTLNLVTSPGLDYTVLNDGTKLDVTPNVRTSYFATRASVQYGLDTYCAASASNSLDFSCSLATPLQAYADGMQVLWKVNASCTGGGAVTLNIDGLGALRVYQGDGVTAPSGTQCDAGSQALLAYSAVLNGGAGGWTILSGNAVVPLTRRAIPHSFQGNGAALTAGAKAYVADIPFACVISGWALAVDQGTATVDVWMVGDGNSVPTVANSITASTQPAVAAVTRLRSNTLTGWTVQVPVHAVLAFQLSAVSLATSVNITLECDQ